MEKLMVTEERKTNKIISENVKIGDIMGIMYYVKVKDTDVDRNDSVRSDKLYAESSSITTVDLDRDMSPIVVRGKSLIEGCLSADQFYEEMKSTKTQIAEILVTSYNRPFSVCFEKQGGEKRIIRGRLIQAEPLLGRSMVEDLDITKGNKLRQVDHRTIEWLIVDGVKYKVPTAKPKKKTSTGKRRVTVKK